MKRLITIAGIISLFLILSPINSNSKEPDTDFLFYGEPAHMSIEGFIFVKGGCYNMGDAFGDGVSENTG